MSSAVIITAAGSSRRFNSSSENTGLKKEFLCIDDLPVLCHAILPFLQMEDLAVLAVTYREGDLETVRKLVLQTPGIAENKRLEILFVQGGATRQESVFNALKSLEQSKKSSDIK